MTFVHSATKYSGLAADQFAALRDREPLVYEKMMRNRVRITFRDTLSSTNFYKIQEWCEDQCSKYFFVSEPVNSKTIIHFEDEAEASTARLYWHGREE